MLPQGLSEDQASAQGSALPPAAAAALTFGASAAVLVLELTALRLIAPYVGLTLETSTAVIGAALSAIALGAWAGGATADRTSPRRVIGPLLLVSGALTLIVNPAVRWMAEVGNPTTAAVNSLLFAAVTVFVPAAVLSAIPPMVVKLQLATLSETGSVVGRLSAISTLGAIAATFVTGFVLILLFPVSIILLGTGVALIGAGLVVVLTAGRKQGPHALSVAGPVAVAIFAGAVGVVAPNPCDQETRYHCVSVITDSGRTDGRTLRLDNAQHSYVALNDPKYLDFDYVRAMAGVLDAASPGRTPLDVLHVGGGAMTLPRYQLVSRDGGLNTVIEIDPGIIQVDRQRLGLPTSRRLDIRAADARTEVRRLADDSYDAYVGDAFSGVAVPWHLTTRETVADVDRVLRPDGVFTQNIIDFEGLRFLAAGVATVGAVFDHVAVYEQTTKTDGGGNFVVIASQRPLDRVAIKAAVAKHEAPMRLMPDSHVQRWRESALVLTDDYAPVDQLISRE
ncbi:MAG TPA: fused MFS/spermidine synthase [Aeromicrobium sp.]|nr:fused MFS/spermidine synthase [Aeromicrobium sp.]